MSMNPDTPAACSASPLMAWMDAGTSRTFCELSLLAVTTISTNEESVFAVSAACAISGQPNDAMSAAPAASRLRFSNPVKRRPFIARMAHPSAVVQIQYELSYEISSLWEPVAHSRHGRSGAGVAAGRIQLALRRLALADPGVWINELAVIDDDSDDGVSLLLKIAERGVLSCEDRPR